MLCLFTMRKMFLIGAINFTQTKIMDCQKRKFDLQKYGTAMSDGRITWEEMLDMPKNMIRRTNHYISNVQNNAVAFAEQNTGIYVREMMNERMSKNPNYQISEEDYYNMENFVREKLIQRELDEAKKQQEKIIAYEENKIEMEQKKLETRLNAYTQELANVEKAEGQAIQQSTAKYVMG